jgi:hypothetical protein
LLALRFLHPLKEIVMYWHTADHLKEDEPRSSGRLVHRGFWLERVPRLMLLCRLRGHRPVVDGYGPDQSSSRAARWVACGRCGVRPEPQGSLEPAEWKVGQRYDGLWCWPEFTADIRQRGATAWTPGRWLVIGKTFGLFSAELKVGNAGSEQVLAGHLRVWPIGALYLHTEQIGAWVQRRLNPDGYDSRIISLSIDGWQIRTQVWARRDHWSRDDPRWMHNRLSLDLVEKVFGPKRYSYTDSGTGDGLVCLGIGEVHSVGLTLKRQRLGRPRLERRARYSWLVEWTAVSKDGIPTGRGRASRVAAVAVADDAVTSGEWASAACTAIAEDITRDRARYGYRAANAGSHD